jgi:hypothetical protein
MSQLGKFQQYPEERDQPRRRVIIPWKFLSASPKANEYHLIDLATGVSHGVLTHWPGLAKALAKKV